MFLGIIGGMGPNATINFLQKLNDFTPSNTEQEHVPYLLISTPEIPDRSSAILSENHILIEKIRKMLIKNVKLLENKVSHIIMICNTAHYWEEDIKKSTLTPFISIIEETCKYIEKKKYNNDVNTKQ